MVFSSLIFLYAFFPVSLAAYCLCPTARARRWALLLASLIFYAWADPKYVLLLMGMSAISWVCALGADRGKEKGRLWVAAAVVSELGLLGFFKYAGLLCSLAGHVPEVIGSIVLPIGISFYTFQLLTYVVDVYRGDAVVQKNYWNVLLYAALFHQCIAGPIVRYRTVAEELFTPGLRKGEWAEGISRFSMGLAKKVLLANPCGALADVLILPAESANAAALAQTSVLAGWVGVLAYSLHIYLDFSAYSDMAIGMGRMVGLHYPENFNYPYIARSVTEFWRRWHMSLGTFFRDYVYIPLGGSRVRTSRAVFNTFVVWALTGLWHGAEWNFLFWGLWFFLLLMLERYLIKPVLEKCRVVSHVYLLFAVAVGWVIFRFTQGAEIAALLGSLLGVNGNPLWDMETAIRLQNNGWLLAVSVLACTPVVPRLGQLFRGLAEKNGRLESAWLWLVYGLIPPVLLLLSTACLVGDSYNPFLYFRF